jgi:TRAP-type C4-dicarboxylate transport system permease small subunit
MIERILRGYCRSVRYVVGLIGRSVSYLLPVLASIVAYEVFARYILGKPTIWAYDTSLFLFGYISALGGAYAQQRDAHINVDIFHAKVTETTRRVFDIVTSVIAIGFLAIMVKVCGGMFMESLDFHYKTQSEWAPSTHHFWLMITISAAIFLAEYSTELVCNIFYLIKGRELMGEHELSSLSELPFKVDSHQLDDEAKFDKESPNGN